MITTILLLPHAETRERLLAPGVLVQAKRLGFGWVVAGLDSDGDIRVYWERDHDAAWCCVEDWPTHLVLARSGAVVPEGVDRLERVGTRPSTLEFVLWVMLKPDFEPKVTALTRLKSITTPLGTLLLLDENGEVAGG